MPKGPREISETGYYHVVTRTVGGIPLFEDDKDRKRYLFLLKKYHDELGIRIIAWVLMNNHVHLVLDCGEDANPTPFMRRLDIAYAAYFRAKTDHKGHLFQEDYWSKPILNDEQLISTVDYVHRNPERACIASMTGYRWSSMQEYLGKLWVVDTSIILELMGNVESLVAFVGRMDDVVRMRDKDVPRQKLTDDEALLLAKQMAGVETSSELRSRDVKLRPKLMSKLAENGVTQRQIANVFGISKSTVSRLLAKPS